MRLGRPAYIIVLGLVVSGAVLAAISLMVIRTRPGPLSPEPLPLTPISSSRFVNTSAEAQFIGSERCIACHAEEAASYRQTAHSRALAEVNPQTEPAGAVFLHQASGREYAAFERDGKVYHQETLRSAAGTTLASVEFPVRYLIGSGRHTRSYLVQDQDFWVQSPITWYASTKAWGMSPGYDTADHWGFGRMVGTDCLTCHTGSLNTTKQQYRGITVTEQAIGCERCHGPGSLHAERHKRGTSRGGEDLTIVHPAALDRRLLEAVCGQCHLQSAATARVRGREFAEFRPGLPLTDFWVDYQLDRGNDEMTVTGHMEQMRRSRCYQQSPTLTCTTCHAMHASPEDASRHYQQKCLECHAVEDCQLDAARRQQLSPQDDCIHCHMPTSRTEIPHVAFTHHRIGVHGDVTAATRPADVTLVPVEDISHLPAIDQQRCLGLAYLQYAEKSEVDETAQITRRKAMDALTSVYDGGLQDGETLAALARLFVEQNDAVAEDLASRALASPGIPVAARCEALFVLADIDFRAERWAKAVGRLKQLVALRRMYEDWFLLGSCHYLNRSPHEAIAALEQASRIDPFRSEVHHLLSRSYAQIGDQAKALQHGALEQSLRGDSAE